MAEMTCCAYGRIYKGDYTLIMAAGHDRAAQLARKAGRDRWSDEDHDAACALIDSLCKSAADRFPVALFKSTRELA